MNKSLTSLIVAAAITGIVGAAQADHHEGKKGHGKEGKAHGKAHGKSKKKDGCGGKDGCGAKKDAAAAAEAAAPAAEATTPAPAH